MEGEAGSQAKSLIWILFYLIHCIGLLGFLPLNLEILQKIYFALIIKNDDGEAISAKRKAKRIFKKQNRLHSLYMNASTK